MITPYALEFVDARVSFAGKDGPYTAISGIDLKVAAGEFVCVVGPTGCGKSTLLNVAAGLIAPSQGRVLVSGAELGGLNTAAGYLFQSEALMPWRYARDNVAAGLRFRGVSILAARAAAETWLR